LSTFSKILNGTKLTLRQADITTLTADAIVNAANSGLLGGGGVDGAIHRAAGPKLLQACKAIRKEQGKCPTGGAVITEAGKLSAQYVIHAVGPIWRGGQRHEDELLTSAYTSVFKLARDHNAHAIALPSISTGAYSFPIERAAPIALASAAQAINIDPGFFTEITWALFSSDAFTIFQQALTRLVP